MVWFTTAGAEIFKMGIDVTLSVGKIGRPSVWFMGQLTMYR